MGKDLKGNPLPPGIMQRKSGIYRGRFYYKGETYTKDNADLKKLVQEMEDLRYEVKHGLKGKGDNITLDTWFDIWLKEVCIQVPDTKDKEQYTDDSHAGQCV